MTQAIRSLLAGLIDYAGVFPPAKLAMQPAVEAYARSRMGAYEWMLGRFVCAATRLEELSAAGASLMPGTHATSGYREHADTLEPWRVTVVVDGTLDDALRAVEQFNRRHSAEDRGLALADAVELKVADTNTIDAALDAIPDDIYPFFELPVAQDCRGLIAALSGTASAAKIRTGGVTADAFPTAAQVAAFIGACAAADVPFKATAGLHHPVRAEYPLTYEPGCPRAVMHGFLNVFLAAAFVRMTRADESAAVAILETHDPVEFHFTEAGVRWRDRFLEPAQLAHAREAFALSYGSCSFDDPVDDLKKLGLL